MSESLFSDDAIQVVWTKLVIIGMPGMVCGHLLDDDGGEPRPADAFQRTFGVCDNDARWVTGMLLTCQDHAAKLAAEFGDDIADIERDWREQCL